MENNLWQNQDGFTQGHQVPGLQKYMKAGVRIIVSNQTLLQLFFENVLERIFVVLPTYIFISQTIFLLDSRDW